MSSHPDLIDRLENSSGLIGAGVHDALSGLIAQRSGFDFLWASSFGISAVNGIPDAGLLTMNDQLRQCEAIAEAASLPVIADCDGGYSDPIQMSRAARAYARAGVAGICIEDSAGPKRSSLYSGFERTLVDVREQQQKIVASKEGAAGLFVIARTEAFLSGGDVDPVLERAYAYVEAGADAILVHSVQKTAGQIELFADKWDGAVPLVAVPTTYGTVPAGDLHDLGYRLVILANVAIRAAARAMTDYLTTARRYGMTSVVQDNICTVEEVNDLVGLDLLRASQRRLAAGRA